LPDGELKVAFEGRNASTLRHAYHEHETRGEPKPCGQDQGGEKEGTGELPRSTTILLPTAAKQSFWLIDRSSNDPGTGIYVANSPRCQLPAHCCLLLCCAQPFYYKKGSQCICCHNHNARRLGKICSFDLEKKLLLL